MKVLLVGGPRDGLFFEVDLETESGLKPEMADQVFAFESDATPDEVVGYYGPARENGSIVMHYAGTRRRPDDFDE